ncbi:MAG: hypothetical protein ACU0CA_00950 [Paracoccaceae bacterium]
MKTATLIGALGVTTLLATGFAMAQTEHVEGMDHSMHQDESAAVTDLGAMETPLTEPGQGAFAALSEVVRVLEADPDTDWASVNLTALRDHLIDMDVLVRDAVVAQEVLSNGLKSTVTGDAESLATAKRMVPAHGRELAKDDRWAVEVEVGENAVVLTVISLDPAVVARIQALGFYGLMASQDHHRAHHYIIAKGGDAHSGH